MTQTFYVISRDLGKCEVLCDMCFAEIPALENGPVKMANWAYRHNRNWLKHMQETCPSDALRIDQI